ncbi:MAG: hypothetical protein JO179_07825 [Solirubrobacterales bacterium]|nr:hypothetical protein [Solirubrobacterales bacterium]
MNALLLYGVIGLHLARVTQAATPVTGEHGAKPHQVRQLLADGVDSACLTLLAPIV